MSNNIIGIIEIKDDWDSLKIKKKIESDKIPTKNAGVNSEGRRQKRGLRE